MGEPHSGMKSALRSDGDQDWPRYYIQDRLVSQLLPYPKLRINGANLSPPTAWRSDYAFGYLIWRCRNQRWHHLLVEVSCHLAGPRCWVELHLSA